MFKKSRKFVFSLMWFIFAIVSVVFSFILIGILGQTILGIVSVTVAVVSFAGIINLITLGGEAVRDVKISTPMGSVELGGDNKEKSTPVVNKTEEKEG
jgi:glucan phosphoethanolaminetransferase (alkaline phosphatase superfamily)